MTSFEDNKKWREAARLGLQSAVAAALLFLLMKSFQLPEKFVGIISAVLVVSPGLGNTLVNSKHRILATLVGCVLGSTCLILLPAGYGTVWALGISMLVMNGVAAFRPSWRYGAVAAVALSLGSESNLMATALERTIAIGLGVSVGSVVALVVWPEKSSTRARRAIRHALRETINYLDATVADTSSPTNDERVKETRSRGARHLEDAKDAASNVRIADPSELRKWIGSVDRIHQAVSLLDRVRGNLRHLGNEYGKTVTEPVRKIQQDTEAVLEAITASGDSPDPHNVNHLRTSIDEIRREVCERTDRADPEETTRNHAVVFALDEIAEGVSQLMEVGATP